MTANQTEAMQLYRTMLRIRRFEERVSGMFAEGSIPGFLHLYIGQEAVAAGVCAHLTQDDFITSTHRGHGHCIAKGADVQRMFAELLGRSTGYCKGKGGSMHVADVEIGILGANGIVGAGMPIAVGAALSAKIRQSQQVAVAFFGEGAAGTGYFHEAMNMAAVLQLPVIFVCESNQYAEFTPRSKHLPIETVAERANAYGMESEIVDGNDVLAVSEAFHRLVAAVRTEQKPRLIECFTNRWRGHYEGDPQRYRPDGEEEAFLQLDPIPALAKRMIEEFGVAQPVIEQIHDEVETEMETAIQVALASPLPQREDLLTDVYA